MTHTTPDPTPNDRNTGMTSTMAATALAFAMDDGVVLRAEAWGDPSGKPVLLSHGGGQTRHAWKGTGEALARQGWYAVAYDHRGHGDSDWSPDGIYRLDRFATDQYRIARQFSGKPALVGASLGGLSAIAAEDLYGPGVYSALVLVDITPQMNQQGALKIMAFMEENMHEGFADLHEAAEVIARFTGRAKRVNTEGLKKNLRLHADGRYRWHWDPKFLSMRTDDSGDPNRLVHAMQAIRYPVCLVRGMMSEVVTEDVAQQFLQQVPHAHYVDVKDASHMVAGDRNDVFTASVIEFLSRV